jgi:hypothetical protein
MSDLRYRRPNARLEALFDQADRGPAPERLDDPIPAFVMPPFDLLGADPVLEFEEGLADSLADDEGFYGPRMPFEPKP